MKNFKIILLFFVMFFSFNCKTEKILYKQNENLEMYNLYINELSENEIIIFSGVYDFNENSVIKNIKETSVRIAYFPDTFNVHYWDFSSDIIFDNLQKPIYVYPYCGRIIAKTQRISKDEIYDIIILKNVRFKYNNKKIIFNNTFYFPSDTACLNAGIKIDE